MKVSGLNLTVVRGETANIVFSLTNEWGEPFILLATEMFSSINVRFRVKRDPLSIVTSNYVINKLFDINNIHRFDSAVIVNLKDYILEAGGTYNDAYWAGNTLPNNDPFPNQLFYHPGIDEYAYYNDESEWELYILDVTVPFVPHDTEGLDYGDYFYDLVIEAQNDNTAEYELIVIPQSRFTIDYRT